MRFALEWLHVDTTDLVKVQDALGDACDFGVALAALGRHRGTHIHPTEDAQFALRKLGEIDVDQLPVVEGELLSGMLSRSDLARWLELHVGGAHRIGGRRVA